MNRLHDAARSLAYLVVTGGCLLAVAIAFEPQSTGAWHLVAVWLICGLIPYIVYGSLTTVLDDCTLLTAGLLLLAADLVARAGLGFTAAAHPDPLAPIRLVTVLVPGILPAGVLAGTLLGRLPACRRGCDNPGHPG